MLNPSLSALSLPCSLSLFLSLCLSLLFSLFLSLSLPPLPRFGQRDLAFLFAPKPARRRRCRSWHAVKVKVHTAERAVEEVLLLDAWLASCYPPGSANVRRWLAKHGGTFSKPFCVVQCLSSGREVGRNCNSPNPKTAADTCAIAPMTPSNSC